MTTIPLRVSTQLLVQMLRLEAIRGEITGATFDSTADVVTFDVATPDTPPGTTEMRPTYTAEWPSGRYFMTDPGFTFAGGAQ